MLDIYLKLRQNCQVMSPRSEDKASLSEDKAALLEELFPRCFSISRPRPLKVGILEELLQTAPDDVSRRQLRKALGSYVRRFAYLRSFESSKCRIGLDGKKAAELSDTEIEWARLRLTQIKAELNTRRKSAVTAGKAA
jgi:ProP effector